MVTSARVKAENHLPLGIAMLVVACGCTPSDKPPARPVATASSAVPAPDDGKEIEALRAEVARLKTENARLRLTPAALAAEVEDAVRAGDSRKADDALKRLASSFPHSAELGPATRRVEGLVAKLQAAEEQRKRVAALGFKALKVSPTFVHDGTALSVASTSLGRRWIFDSYGDGVGWRYLDAERGQRLLVARLAVNSKNKNPSLFGIGVYLADGETMTQVGTLRYRFARWLDFGAYLGNHADFRNDFAHNPNIRFSAGAAVAENLLNQRPLYLVVTREGCHERLHDRLVQPPIHYIPRSCASLKKTLTVDDFKDGSLAILRRID